MALPLYAASELLTVPTTAVPEPSTMGPAAVAGLAGPGWAASGPSPRGLMPFRREARLAAGGRRR